MQASPGAKEPEPPAGGAGAGTGEGELEGGSTTAGAEGVGCATGDSGLLVMVAKVVGTAGGLVGAAAGVLAGAVMKTPPPLVGVSVPILKDLVQMHGE